MKRIHNPNLALWATIFNKNLEIARQSAANKNADISTRDLSPKPKKGVLANPETFVDLVTDETSTRGFFSSKSFSEMMGDLKQGLLKQSEKVVASTLQTILTSTKATEITHSSLTSALAAFGFDKGTIDDNDGNFIRKCLIDYYDYHLKNNGVSKYYDWRVEGKGDVHFGEIEYRLPSTAKVALIGDWGSGLPDAKLLLKTILTKHKPDVVIHVGDIYYSGTVEECENNFLKIFQEAFEETGHTCRVFNLAGNHDYYAFGEGFFHILPKLNPTFPDSTQQASFFSLKTEDGKWQLLGMDTGFNDAKPFEQFDKKGPDLLPSEKEWLTYQLDNHKGKTILFSHHQLFSANDTLLSEEKPYLNTALYKVFEPYFKKKVKAWFWGHEHNLVLYQENLFGLKKGRLIGCSAYQENVGEGDGDPYFSHHPEEVPYLHPEKYRLSHKNGFYYHGYGLLSFTPKKVTASYWECPTLNHGEDYTHFEASMIHEENL